MAWDDYIVAPHTAACIADENSCPHGPRLTAEFTSGAGEPHTLTMALGEEVQAAFVELADWDGPEVLNALCMAGLLDEDDFGGQGDLVGRTLVGWRITEPAISGTHILAGWTAS